MAKVEELVDIESLQNETSAVQLINSNKDKVETAFSNTLSRDGSTPNSMQVNFDMAGYKIINLAAAVDPTDAVRKSDLDAATGGLDQTTIDAILAAPAAAISAADSAAEAAASAILASGYIGGALTADKWTSARTLTLSGVLSGNQSFDGSANFTVTASYVDGSITGAKLSSGAAVANIGYTPSNRAGDTFTGDVVLASSPATLSQYSAGFRGVPVIIYDADTTFGIGDSAKMARHTSATPHAWTIPPNATITYPVGTVLVGRNFGSGVVTLTRGAGVAIRLAGSGTSQDVAVAQYGMYTALQEAIDVWVVNGAGLT